MFVGVDEGRRAACGAPVQLNVCVRASSPAKREGAIPTHRIIIAYDTGEGLLEMFGIEVNEFKLGVIKTFLKSCNVTCSHTEIIKRIKGQQNVFCSY